MSIRKDIAELRAAILYLKRLAIPDVDNFALERVLDFTEEAIAALRADGHRSGGYAAHEANHSRPCSSCAALAKLGEESR